MQQDASEAGHCATANTCTAQCCLAARPLAVLLQNTQTQLLRALLTAMHINHCGHNTRKVSNPSSRSFTQPKNHTKETLGAHPWGSRTLRSFTSDQELINCFQMKLYSNTHRFGGFHTGHNTSSTAFLQNRRLFGRATASPQQMFTWSLLVLPHLALVQWSPSCGFIKRHTKKFYLAFKLFLPRSPLHQEGAPSMSWLCHQQYLSPCSPAQPWILGCAPARHCPSLKAPAGAPLCQG